MGHAAGAGMGFFTLIISILIIIIAILAFFLPLFVYQIKNDIAKMRTTIDALGQELSIIQKNREKEEKNLKRQAHAARTRAAKQRMEPEKLKPAPTK